jgi:hypothetical protein
LIGLRIDEESSEEEIGEYDFTITLEAKGDGRKTEY